MPLRRLSSLTSVIMLSMGSLQGEEGGVSKAIDLMAPRLPAKTSPPVPTVGDAHPTPPPLPQRQTRLHTGPVQPYDRLSRDNIHVTAHNLESGSSGMNRWIYYWRYYHRSRTVTQNRLIEVHLSGIGNKGGDVTVQCYAVIRRNGGSEVTTRCADQDIITDGTGKWCVSMQATRSEYQYENGRRIYTSGEKIVGFFVRVIRDGRIVGYAALPSAYERFALDTSLQ